MPGVEFEDNRERYIGKGLEGSGRDLLQGRNFEVFTAVTF